MCCAVQEKYGKSYDQLSTNEQKAVRHGVHVHGVHMVFACMHANNLMSHHSVAFLLRSLCGGSLSASTAPPLSHHLPAIVITFDVHAMMMQW